MRERDIEAYLIKRVKEEGGEVRKLKWIGRRGAPDRMVMLNGAHLPEIKRPGEKLEPHQEREHQKMMNNGILSWVLDSYEMVDRFIDWATQRGKV